MPITVGWDNDEKTVICYSYEGRWTWDEYYAVLEQSRVLWDQVNHPVDIIVDLRANKGFPSGNMLGHFRNTMKYYDDPKAGNTVIVGMSDFFRMSVDLFNRIYPPSRYKPTGNFFFIKNMDEAQTILAQYRQPSPQKAISGLGATITGQ